MENSTEAQRSAEALARKAELAAKREVAIKARLQAEAESIDEKTIRLRRLRMAKEGHAPGPIDHIEGRPQPDLNRSLSD